MIQPHDWKKKLEKEEKKDNRNKSTDNLHIGIFRQTLTDLYIQ